MRGIIMRLPRRRGRSVCAATCFVLAVVVATVLAACSDLKPAPPVPTSAGGGGLSAAGSATSPGSQVTVSPPDGLVTPNQDEYAAVIGALMFEMDTRTSTAGQTREQLRREADAQLSDDGLADLYATIDARVPADALWERMRSNEQWSQWEPIRTWEPAAWAQVVTQGHAAPGWVMRNVTGVQTIHYVEDGLSRSTSREVTLTVVMRCPTEGVDLPSCRLVLISTQPAF